MDDDLKICRICGEEIKNNFHFKKHKLTQKEYYETYYEKFDWYTNEKIPFTNIEKYFNSEFTNKKNQKAWLLEQDELEQIAYIKEKLEKRVKEKHLTYAPSEVELSTCPDLPSRKVLESICDLDSICKELKLINRFESPKTDIICDPYYQNNDKHWINIDPREQKPFKLKYPTQIKKLDFGDYSLNTPTKCGNIFVERKNLIDFVCTMSGGFDRFQAEILRARSKNAFLIVLVEDAIQKLYAIEKLPQFKYTKIKAKPEFITFRMRSLMEQFGNINFVFCNGRKDSVQTLYKIFFSNGVCKTIDIQLAKIKNLI